MSCSEIKETIGLGEDVTSEESIRHLASCSSCNEYVAENRQLNESLKAMSAREVPSNFNQEVRSRIAVGSSAKDWGPWIGVAVPAAAVCLIAAFVLLNPGLYTDTSGTQTIAKDQSETVEVKQPVDQAPFETGDLFVEKEDEDSGNESDKERPSEPEDSTDFPSKEIATTEKAERTAVSPKPEEEIFSKDLTATEPEVSLPPGLEGNEINKRNAQARTFKPADILQPLGIGSSRVAAGMKVTSVAKNSLAEKAGIKVGDVVIALDGKSIRKTLTAASIRGNTVTVIRNGKRMKISVRN